MNQPLAGRRILVTRAAKQAGKLSEGLRALGAEAVEVPVIEIHPLVPNPGLDAVLEYLANYDWLIFTSTNSVRILVDRAVALGVSLSELKPQVAAVGQATADSVRQAGLNVSITPDDYVAESLVSALAGRVKGKQVLLGRAVMARDVIPDSLRAEGAQVDVVNLYQNAVPAGAPDRLRQAWAGGLAAATFTSSSSVRHLGAVAKEAGLEWPLPNVRAVSIGPITSQTLRECGWTPAAEAVPHDIPGLINAVKQALETV